MLALRAEPPRHVLELSSNGAVGRPKSPSDVLADRPPPADARVIDTTPVTDHERPPPDPVPQRPWPQGSGGYHVVAE